MTSWLLIFYLGCSYESIVVVGVVVGVVVIGVVIGVVVIGVAVFFL